MKKRPGLAHFQLKKSMNLKILLLFNVLIRLNTRKKQHQVTDLLKILFLITKKNGSVTSSYPKIIKSTGNREHAKKQIESIIAEFLNLSIRKMTSANSFSTTLVFHILHDDFKLKPYKYQDWHKFMIMIKDLNLPNGS